MIATDETPRVWVGCLGCYNAGHLLGEWVDAEDADDEAATKLITEGGNVRGAHTSDHDAAPHEEWWCFDVENMPGGEMSPSTAAKIGRALAAVDGPVGAVRAYIENAGLPYIDWDTLADDFEEAYAGEWDSFEAYADELADDIGLLSDVPESVRPYFALDRWARDLILGGDYWTEDSPAGVYVFRSN
jgi:antirestriction protein